MNYECIAPFTGHNGLNYHAAVRIGQEEYNALQTPEKANFKALQGETFADQIADMIKREDELENE